MENCHEHKSYGQQWKEDLSAEGWKRSVAPLFPTPEVMKEQSKICYNVLCKGLYYAGKFCFTKHE